MKNADEEQHAQSARAKRPAALTRADQAIHLHGDSEAKKQGKQRHALVGAEELNEGPRREVGVGWRQSDRHFFGIQRDRERSKKEARVHEQDPKQRKTSGDVNRANAVGRRDRRKHARRVANRVGHARSLTVIQRELRFDRILS